MPLALLALTLSAFAVLGIASLADRRPPHPTTYPVKPIGDVACVCNYPPP